MLILSSWVPLSEAEKMVSLFPIDSPLGIWLERALLTPWLRWDAIWFMKITEEGYHIGNGTLNFHPLYPTIAAILSSVLNNSLLSLLFVSSLSTLFLLWIFEALSKLDLPPDQARLSTLLFISYPLGFVLYAPYSESLFLLFAILCLWWARQGNWLRSGLAGGFAALTRQQGLFLLLPMLWEAWESSNHQPMRLLQNRKFWLSLILVCACYGAWTYYRVFILEDLQNSPWSLQKLIYSVFISPDANMVVPIQKFLPPWQVISSAINHTLTESDIDSWTNLIFSIVFVSMVLLTWRYLRISYRFYIVAIILVSLGYYTGPAHPTMGLIRHLYLAFPVFIGLAHVTVKPWQRLLAFGISILGMSYLILVYATEAWVL